MLQGTIVESFIGLVSRFHHSKLLKAFRFLSIDVSVKSMSVSMVSSMRRIFLGVWAHILFHIVVCMYHH